MRLALALLILIPTLVHAQNKHPKVGEAAPPLKLSKVLDTGKPFKFEKGTCYVVDFWAPWCGSCVAEFPRINALVDEMKGKPVEFIAITDEPENKVRALIKSRPLNARVVLDDKGATFKTYGVAVLPTTFLIDADGKLVAATTFKHIDKEVLTKLVTGVSQTLPEANFQPADLEWDNGKAGFDAELSVAHVIIQRSEAGSGGSMFAPNTGRISGDGVVFGNLIQLAYGAEYHEIRSTHPEYNNTEKKYRISVKAADDKPETARAMLREQLERMFDYKAEWVTVEEAVPVLRKIDGVNSTLLRKSSADKMGGMARSGSIKYVKIPFPKIAEIIGSLGYRSSIVDETGLTGEYDLTLEWTPGDTASFEAALKKAGLQVTKESRKVRRLLLSPKG
jgi:uncharacterized protein (TIGR03435 family)